MRATESATLPHPTSPLMCQSQVCRIHNRLRLAHKWRCGTRLCGRFQSLRGWNSTLERRSQVRGSVVSPFSHVAFLLSCVVSSEFEQLVPAHKLHTYTRDRRGSYTIHPRLAGGLPFSIQVPALRSRVLSGRGVGMLVVWLARPSHLTARGTKGKGRSSGSND